MAGEGAGLVALCLQHLHGPITPVSFPEDAVGGRPPARMPTATSSYAEACLVAAFFFPFHDKSTSR